MSDFRRGVRLLRGRAPAIELSALRTGELPQMVQSLSELDLAGFSYVSVHAPSTFSLEEESQVVRHLQTVPAGWPIILHPDTISNWPAWLEFGNQLLIENMDKRKPDGRTADELKRVFERLPEAGLCFDLAHARQVDPTMTEALLILREFGSRIRQVHLSEVSTGSKHARLSYGAILAYRGVGTRIPSDVPIILEGPVDENEVESEIRLARQALPMNSVTIFVNNIPAPRGEFVEEAAQAAIGDLPGDWYMSLIADQQRSAYQVRIRNGDGPEWSWEFDGPYEQKPEVIRQRIWNGLRLTVNKTFRERREEILQIARQYGGMNVRVFGSHVNGEPRPDSDLDILLVMEPGRSLFDLIGIKQDLEHLLGCKVDVITEDGISPYLRERILQEAVAL